MCSSVVKNLCMHYLRWSDEPPERRIMRVEFPEEMCAKVPEGGIIFLSYCFSFCYILLTCVF